MITSIRLWLARKLAPDEFERLDSYRLRLCSLRQWLWSSEFADIYVVIEWLAASAGDAEKMGMPADAHFEPVLRDRIRRMRGARRQQEEQP